MDRYRSLQAFVAIVDAGGITQASRHLNVSKSVISDRLTALEHLVGERLLARTTRSMTLTDAGRSVYDDYAPLVARLGELAFSGSSRKLIEGRLRVASMLDVGMHEVSEAIGAVRTEHPQLKVELVLGNEAADPRTGGFDLAFHFRRARAGVLEQEAVGSMACACYASPDYLARHGQPAEPRELMQHDCLGYSFQAGVDDWNTSVWSFTRSRDRHRVPVRLAFRANSATVLRDLAAAGHGIVILPRLRANAAVTAGRLTSLLDDWALPSLTLFAVYAPGVRTTARARVLVDAVRARLSAA